MRNEIANIYLENGHGFHSSFNHPVPVMEQNITWERTADVLQYIRNKSLPIVFLSGSTTKNTRQLQEGCSEYSSLTNWPLAIKPILKDEGFIPVDGHFISLHQANPQLAAGLTTLNILLAKKFVIVINDLSDLPGIGVSDELNIAKQVDADVIYFITDKIASEMKKIGRIPENLEHNAFLLGIKKSQWVFGMNKLLNRLKQKQNQNVEKSRLSVDIDDLVRLNAAATFISQSMEYPDIRLWLMTIIDYIEEENRKTVTWNQSHPIISILT